MRPELVREVAAAVAPVPLQASGGIRSLADAQALLAAGADRVIVGTAAWPDPTPWAEALGRALVVALDVRDGTVRAAGWTEEAGLAVAEAVERCLAAGVERVLCTAIERDGTLAGPDLELVELRRRPRPARPRRGRRPLARRRRGAGRRRAPRQRSSAELCFCLGGDERQIRLQRREVEPVRCLPAVQEVGREDAVRLVAVALPERPGHLLDARPR